MRGAATRRNNAASPNTYNLALALTLALALALALTLTLDPALGLTLTSYGVGGVNYAHQDQNSSPWQAALLL